MMNYFFILSFILFHIAETQNKSHTIFSSGWHIIFEEKISSENIQLIQSYLDTSKEYYQNEWGLKLPGIISIHVYASTTSFQEATHQDWFTAALWDGSVIHIQNPSALKKRMMLKSAIAHEISHIAIQSLWKQKPPLWFEEGFAVYSSGEMSSLPRPRKKINRLDDMNNEQMKSTNFHARQQWYSTVGTLIFIYVHEFGKDQLKNIFKQASQKSFEESIASVLKTPYNHFEKKIVNSFNQRKTE